MHRERSITIYHTRVTCFLQYNGQPKEATLLTGVQSSYKFELPDDVLEICVLGSHDMSPLFGDMF